MTEPFAGHLDNPDSRSSALIPKTEPCDGFFGGRSIQTGNGNRLNCRVQLDCLASLQVAVLLHLGGHFG